MSSVGRVTAAAAISNFGDGVFFVAVPLLASSVTSSPFMIAAVTGFLGLPHLLLALPIGAAVDRTSDKRALMVQLDAARVAVLAMLAAAVLIDRLSIALLIAGAVAVGICELAFDTASQALIPEISERGDLFRNNSRLATVIETGNGLLGPAAGGVLYGLGRSVPIIVNLATFVASAAVLAGVRQTNSVRDADTAADSGSSPGEGMLAGLRWIVRSPLRGLLILSVLWSFFGWLPEGPFVLYVIDELDGSATTVGLLFAMTSLGAIVGGLVSTRSSSRLSLRSVLGFGLLLYGLGFLGLAMTSSAVVAAFVLVVQGVPLLAWTSATATVRQVLTPPTHYGRVTSVFMVANSGAGTLGLFCGGLLAESLGVRSVLWIAALGLLGTSVVLSAQIARLAERAAALSTPPMGTAVEPTTLER